MELEGLDPETTLVTLPDDLEWVDEFNDTSIVQKADYGVSGSLHVQEAEKLAGRKITLQGKDNMGWISRLTAEQLRTLRNAVNQTMTLTLQDAREFTVMFRQAETPVDISPIRDFNTFEDTEEFKITAIRLMEV